MIPKHSDSYRIWQRESFFRTSIWSKIFSTTMSGLATPIYRWAIEHMDSDLQRYSTILDVGCGNGILAARISESFSNKQFTLVDQSQSQLDAGKRHLHKAARKNQINWQQAEAENLPFADNSFELVMSTGSINLWSPPEQGLAECWRVLKPGGTLWIFDQGPVADLEQLWQALFVQRIFGIGYPGYTEAELHRMSEKLEMPSPTTVQQYSLYGFRWTKA